MSREYIDDPAEDMAWSLRAIRESVERIETMMRESTDVAPRTMTSNTPILFGACPTCGTINVRPSAGGNGASS